MKLRGISYAIDDGDVAWDPAAVRRDLTAIRDDLHCTAVLVFGTDLERLVAASELALELGLEVWFQPRRPERRSREVLAHLDAAAQAAEALRARHPDRVVLVAGCEHSLFTRGIVPGPHLLVRLRLLLRHRRWTERRVTRRLNRLLAQAVTVARARFHGPITYGAALWEQVDWEPFDLVGVNLYRTGDDAAGYAARVRALVRDAGKPVVITEFGCAAHRGAAQTGPGGFMIVDWWRSPPRVKPGHVRDEATQAGYLSELVAVYEAAAVHGAFAFTFAMPSFPHDPDDPRSDLDMAGFGVVKVRAGAWEPKAAFAALARAYGSGG